MPVDVKSYLASMKSISSQTTTNIKNGVANQQDLKTQALLAQLIEALSYAKSMDFRQKTLNAPAVGSEDKTAREILNTMKEQEKLVKQLAEGQALSKDQGDKLTKAIDKFYEMAGATEINYKKFAENLDKFAQQDLPEAVKTRIANDSKDAGLMSKEQSDKENPVIKTLKKIKNYVEDAAESTKQYRKRLFVTLDQFKEGFLDGLDNLGKAIEDSGFFNNLMKNLASLGALGLVLQGFIKEGNYGIPMLTKQFFNLKTAVDAFKEVGGLGTGISKSFKTVGNMIKGFKMIAKQFKFLPKLIKKFGLGKGLGAAAKGIGKGLVKGFGKEALKKIPVIGSLISIWLAIDRWKKGDKVGALIELASGAAAMFPGIGTLASIGLDLINLGRDIDLSGSSQETNKPKKSKFKFNFFSKNKQGGNGLAGTTGAMLSPQATGNAFANNAISVANSMGGRRSQHKCALGVDRAIEKTYKTRLYGDAWQMTNKLKTSKFGKSHFDYKGKSNKMTFAKGELPAGTILGWSRYPGNPYGHIEISDGKGNLMSDFIRSSSGTLGSGYVKYKVKPEIFTPKGANVSVSTSTDVYSDANPGEFVDSESTESDNANEIKTYDDALAAYTEYMNKIQGQINETSGAQTVSGNSWAKPRAIASAQAPVQSSAPPEAQAPASSMTTDIDDTAIAILNSVLFK